jgi:hypothetical protein
MTPRPTRTMQLLASLAVRHRGAPLTFPTDPDPPVEFVKVNRPGEHQQPGRYEFLTSPHAASEPGPGDDSGAFCSDVVATLSHLTQMINERLQFGPSRGE